MVGHSVPCMVGGTGETSYANNSIFQRRVIRKVGPLLEENIKAVCTTFSPECLAIADLGCSSGPNTLSVVESIIDVAVSTYRDSGHGIPEFNVFLNDLHQNDFNSIFKQLPGLQEKLEEEKGINGIQCCVSGTPGSFYGRLFPTNFLHLVHSSTCLHWISQVPKGVTGEDGENVMNKSIHARKGIPEKVLNEYREQFGRDFTLFLKCRSKEVVQGGRLALTFLGTHDEEGSPNLELMGQVLYKLASQGVIDEKKVDGFNIPIYKPTKEKVKQLIEEEGSFAIHKLDTFEMLWASADALGTTTFGSPKAVTSTFRGALEPLLASAFGEDVMDQVFVLYEEMVADHLTKTGQDIHVLHHAVSLIKKP